jgi:hypothetical protein
MITAEGYKMSLPGLLEPLQSPRHDASLRAPLKPKTGLSGPPAILVVAALLLMSRFSASFQ